MKNSSAKHFIKRRLTLVSVIFLVLAGGLFFLLNHSFRAQTDFTTAEISRNEVRRPLLALLELVPQHQFATPTEQPPLAAQIEDALGEIKISSAAVTQAWGQVKSNVAKNNVVKAPNPEAVRARYYHLISTSRTLLAQADDAAAHDRAAGMKQLRAQQNLLWGAAAALVFAALVLAGITLARITKVFAQFSNYLGAESAQLAESVSQLATAGKIILQTANLQTAALAELSESLEEMSSLTQRTSASASAANHFPAVAPTQELLGELANATAEQHLGVTQINAAAGKVQQRAQELAAHAENHLAAIGLLWQRAEALRVAAGELTGVGPQPISPAETLSAVAPVSRRSLTPLAGRATEPAESSDAVSALEPKSKP